jgi:hypothetical protein
LAGVRLPSDRARSANHAPTVMIRANMSHPWIQIGDAKRQIIVLRKVVAGSQAS